MIGVGPALAALALVEGLAGSLPSAGADLPAFELGRLAGGRLASAELSGKPGLLCFVRPEQRESLSVLTDLEKALAEIDPGSFRAVAIAPGALSPASVEDLRRASRWKGEVLLDPDRAAYARFGVVAVPSLIMFDAKGKVLFARPGIGKDLVTEVRRLLRDAVGEPARKATGAEAARRAAAAALERARALRKGGKLADAEALLRREVQTGVAPELSRELAEILLARNEPAEALRVCEEARKRSPEATSLAIGAARALAALGRNGEAATLLREAALHAPGSYEAHLELAALHEKEGKLEEALAEYRKAVEILRNRIESREEKGTP